MNHCRSVEKGQQNGSREGGMDEWQTQRRRGAASMQRRAPSDALGSPGWARTWSAGRQLWERSLQMPDEVRVRRKKRGLGRGWANLIRLGLRSPRTSPLPHSIGQSSWRASPDSRAATKAAIYHYTHYWSGSIRSVKIWSLLQKAGDLYHGDLC